MAPSSRPAVIRRVCRIAAMAAFAATALALLQVTIEVIALVTVGPPPQRVEEWFALIQRNGLIGATELTAFQIPLFALLLPVFAGVYVVTRDGDPVIAALATVTGVVGVAVYLATDPALSILGLGREYAAAATDLERATLVAAGRAMFGIAVISVDVGASVIAVAIMSFSRLLLREPGLRVAAVLGVLAGITQLTAAAIDVFTGYPNILFLEVTGSLMVLWLAVMGLRLRRIAEAA